MKIITESANQQLDQLLSRLCVELAISENQYTRAVSAYSTIGDWIADADGPLACYQPRIFPQGSIPLGTTVKPRRSEEFDADLVCVFQIGFDQLSPQQLYDLILNRVLDHDTYRPMVEPCDRCVRLNYENQFHLDIVPAIPAPTAGATRIAIPNHTKTQWQFTDPEGFLRWFKSRQTMGRRLLAERRADVEPMPDNDDPEDKSTLQRTAQLFKCRRDVFFGGDDSAPKSILLTTLAGMYYGGELIATDAAIGILDQLLAAAKNSAEVPRVINPSNPGENLARHWQEDRKNYLAFLEFCIDFELQVKRLLQQNGTEQIAAVLQELFDPDDGALVKRAVASYTDEFQKARNAGAIRMTKGGALVTSAAAVRSVAIPKTNFFGS